MGGGKEGGMGEGGKGKERVRVIVSGTCTVRLVSKYQRQLMRYNQLTSASDFPFGMHCSCTRFMSEKSQLCKSEGEGEGGGEGRDGEEKGEERGGERGREGGRIS